MIFTDIFPDKFHSDIFRVFEANRESAYQILVFECDGNEMSFNPTIKSWENPEQITISQTMEIGFVSIHLNDYIVAASPVLDDLAIGINFLNLENTKFLY